MMVTTCQSCPPGQKLRPQGERRIINFDRAANEDLALLESESRQLVQDIGEAHGENLLGHRLVVRRIPPSSFGSTGKFPARSPRRRRRSDARTSEH